MLATAWRTWRDRDAALLIVDRFDIAFLVEHLKDLASDLDGSAGMPKLFLRVASERPSLHAQLRKLDGLTYAYVCARLSKTLPVPVAKRLIEEYRKDPRLGILAWSLGKLGYWNLLVELSKEVEEIENNQNQEHYALMEFPSEAIRALTVGHLNGA